MTRSITLSLAATLGLLAAAPAKAGERMPTLFATDFEKGSLESWKMTDDSAWKLEKTDDGQVLALITRRSDYEPKVRSPYNIALIDDVVVTDFDLTLRVKSTKDTGAHRDLCLFFGYQDPEHFYYVHLGKSADPHAHSIFKVDNEPRISIAQERTDGTPWTDGWHKVRIRRDVSKGTIEVYFDDLDGKPIMRTTDKTFVWGKVGIGSFDDMGQFDDLELRGVRYDKGE